MYDVLGKHVCSFRQFDFLANGMDACGQHIGGQHSDAQSGFHGGDGSSQAGAGTLRSESYSLQSQEL